MTRQFEKEVFFKAPVERVWEALTTPEQISIWMGHEVLVFEPRVGGKFQTQGLFPGHIVRFDPPHTLAWEWDPENGKEPVRETLTLHPENGGTRLHLLAISHGRWAENLMYFGGNEAGWQMWLEALGSLLSTGEATLRWGEGKLNAVVDAEETAEGIRLYIKAVIAGSAPEAAGIQAGDTLKSWNGAQLDRPATFWRHAWVGEPGETVRLGLERGGEPFQAEVTLVAPKK